MKYNERILYLFLEKSYTFGISKESILEQLEDYVGDLSASLKEYIEKFNIQHLMDYDNKLQGIYSVTAGALSSENRYLDIAKIYFYNLILKNVLDEIEMEGLSAADVTKDDVIRAYNRFMTIISDGAIDIINDLKPDNLAEIEKSPKDIFAGLADAYNKNEADWVLAMTAILKTRLVHELITSK